MTIDEELQGYISKMIGPYEGNGHGFFFHVPVEDLSRETLLEIIRFINKDKDRDYERRQSARKFLDEIDECINTK